MIVDTHVHITSRDTARYPLVPDLPQDRYHAVLCTAEDLMALMKQGGVDRVVLVQATPTHGYDNSYAADIAQQHPRLFSSVCVVNVSEPAAPDRLSYWIQQRKMGGVRLFNAMGPDDSWLDEPKATSVIDRARSLKTPVTLVTRHHEIARVRNVLGRFPDATFILDHLAYMPNQQRPPFTLSKEFFALASYPNVSLKFSAVNQWAVSKGDLPTRDYFKAIVDTFGPRRLMWGSNYPVTRFRPYPEFVRMGQEPFDFLPQDQRRWIMGENALRFWPAPSS